MLTYLCHKESIPTKCLLSRHFSVMHILMHLVPGSERLPPGCRASFPRSPGCGASAAHGDWGQGLTRVYIHRGRGNWGLEIEGSE